jgi:hypothetical protein
MAETSSPTPLKPKRLTGKLVQFKGYRCMAYQDDDGKWRSLFTGKELTGFLHIVSE